MGIIKKLHQFKMKLFSVLFLGFVAARPAITTTSVGVVAEKALKGRQFQYDFVRVPDSEKNNDETEEPETTTFADDYDLPTTTPWSTTSTQTAGTTSTDKNYIPTTTTEVSTSSGPTMVKTTTDEFSTTSSATTVTTTTDELTSILITFETTDKNYIPTTTTAISTSTTTIEATTENIVQAVQVDEVGIPPLIVQLEPISEVLTENEDGKNDDILIGILDLGPRAAPSDKPTTTQNSDTEFTTTNKSLSPSSTSTTTLSTTEDEEQSWVGELFGNLFGYESEVTTEPFTTSTILTTTTTTTTTTSTTTQEEEEQSWTAWFWSLLGY